MVLIAILTQNFVIILADNVTYERKTPTEVLTSFLKVPWINLDSSWADAEASTCRNDIATVFESADVGEMWALQSKLKTFLCSISKSGVKINKKKREILF